MVERTVKVWDWPVRLTHWGFAVLIPAMWYTAENSHWVWHTRFGTILFGLLVFRLIWGFVGTRTARFGNFVKGPAGVLDFIRGGHSGTVGHSPLAALSVVALLTAMFVQVGMGLFGGDPFDGATGPLNALVSVATADMLTGWHKQFYWVVLGLTGLHLAAIAYYSFAKRQRLIGPMVTGTRSISGNVQANDRATPLLTALALLAGVAIAVWVAFGAPPFSG